MRETPFLAWVSLLVRTQRGALLRVARREGLSPDDALDAVQEGLQSFLELPQARRVAGSDVDARALLSALVRNIARNRRRRHDHSREHVPLSTLERDDSASVEELLAQAQEHVLLLGCVRTLGQLQKAVVTLRLLEGRKGPDAARTLGLTPGHVAVLLNRAKENLRTCLQPAVAAAA